MLERLMSRDFTAEPLDNDDTILEPRPLLTADTLSEVLDRSSTFGSSIDLTGFGGHRDTFALIGWRRMPRRAGDLPCQFFQRLIQFINHDTYLAIRRSCRSWSAAITYVRPPKLPPVYFVPQEVLELVYKHLEPIDLNAARRTCRAWMMASLEWRLLISMLKRGGWWTGFQTDLMAQNPSSLLRTNVNEEWLMSKRLATECSLGPDWTGNGLEPGQPSYSPQVYQAASTALTSTGDKTSLLLTSHIDFSELSDSCYPTRGHSHPISAIHFTVSLCNQFVLLADGCTIYIYRLRGEFPSKSSFQAKRDSHGGHLSPLTSIICPRRVLAVSMDTSSRRFAIAALLDGRMGLVCDLQMSDQTRRPSRNSTRSSSWNPLLEQYRPAGTTLRSGSEGALGPDRPVANILGKRRERSWSHGGSGESNLQARRGMFDMLIGPTDECPSLHSGVDAKPYQTSIPIEIGPRSIYRNLCSDEDPPRSVAICPQRRCVAFGCSAGIELHWADALTGQDLNRWFPLSSPSDYLYFLPPRRGVDSAKKLRLISSAAHRSQRPSLSHHFFPWTKISTRSFWDGVDLSLDMDSVGPHDESDHYQAKPLSDGYHILFTDPTCGMLCLGSDAPLGGPTKLLRKIMFTGPEEGVVPRIYAAGSELRWGVRVVAAYGERLWFFSVPPDILGGCRGRDGDGTESPRPELWGEGLRYEMLDSEGAWSGKWPVNIRGVEIATVQSLVDVAIDSEPGSFAIWAFSAAGEVFTWQIDGGQEWGVRERVVLRDGTVVDVHDDDGDVVMRDAPEPVMPTLQVGCRAISFDGVASMFVTAAREIGSPSTSATGLPGLGWVEHVVEGVKNVEMRDDDSGYGSDDGFEQAGGTFAVRISGRESGEWVPEYLGERSEGVDGCDGALDVWAMTRLEMEVL